MSQPENRATHSQHQDSLWMTAGGPPIGRNLIVSVLALGLSAGPLTAQVSAPPAIDAGTLIKVTPGSSDLLWGLPYDQLDGEEIVAALLASSRSDTELVAGVAETIAGAAGVYADLSMRPSGALERHPLLRGALAAGLPLILEGDGGGERIRALTGVGFGIEPGGAALVQRIGENRYALVKLGAPLEIRDQEETLSIPRTPAGVPGGGSAVRGKGLSSESRPTVDPLAVAALATSFLDDPRILQDTTGQWVSKSSDTQPACPTSSCRQWIFISAGITGSNELSRQWSTASGRQHPFLSISFIITLHDSVNPGFKALTVYTTGEQGPAAAYFGTGGMDKNNDHHRGYFSEKMTLSVQRLSINPEVELGSTSPGNVNGSSSVTTSNALTVGVDGDGGSGSYTASWSYSRDIDDFEIENLANPFALGGLAKWRFSLNATDGGSYNNWQDLLDRWGSLDCDLHRLGSIAKNNLQVATLATWIAPGDYQGPATFLLQAEYKLRKVKSSLTWYGACELTGKSTTAGDSALLSVDFGVVNQQ